MKHVFWIASLCLVTTTEPAPSSHARSTEYVIVQKVVDDKAVVERSNGATYLIEKGIGCISLWRYDGKRVVIDSPGLFLGVGARLLIPELQQECRIWSSKDVDPPRTPPVARAPQITQSGSASRLSDSLSFYDSQGRATAYIVPEDERTLFLWTGEPVAYLVEESIYGFSGKHLGWFRNGRVYDHEGQMVVAIGSVLGGTMSDAPARGLKKLTPLKSLKELTPLQPILGSRWITFSARGFFMLGAE